MASGMIQEIKAHSAPEKLAQLAKQCETDQAVALIQSDPSVWACISELSPDVHTFGFCFVLSARAQHLPESDFEAFFNSTSLFLDNCKGELLIDPRSREISYSKLAAVCEKFAWVANRLNRNQAAAHYLGRAVEHVQTAPGQLTGAHPALLQACLSGRLYHTALRWIEGPCISQVSKGTGCRPQDILVYLYYAGRVYLGVKQYRKACSVLLRALGLPCECSHAALWQCRQMVVFASLLAYGTPPEVRMANPSVSSTFEKMADQRLKSLCDAFSSWDVPKFSEALAKCHDELHRSGHSGLARQCLAALRRRCVLRLAQTNVSASLEQVRVKAGLSDVRAAEALVVEMVQRGELLAKVSQRDQFVIGMEAVPSSGCLHSYQDASSVAVLHASLAKQMELFEGIRDFTDEIEHEPMYIWGSCSEDEKEKNMSGDRALDEALERSKLDQ